MPPTGRYATFDDLRDLIGHSIVWRSETVQLAFDQGDAEIIGAAIKAGWFETPLQPLGEDVARVKQWSVVLTAYRLLLDEEIVNMLAEVRRDMQRAFGEGGQINAVRRGPTLVGDGW